MELTTPIHGVKGVGAKTEQLFQKTGVYTVGDILLRFPREYAQFPEPVEIDEAVADKRQAVILRVDAPAVVKRARSMPVTVCAGRHGQAQMEFVWFRMPYVRNTLKSGETFILYGRAQQKGTGLSMEQPAIYTPEQYSALAGTLQPVYGLTAGLTNNLYRKTLRQVLDEKLLQRDHLPDGIRKKCRLAEYNYAVSQIHFPDSFEALTQARRRLVFDEFFLFILAMRLQKEQVQKLENAYEIDCREELLEPLLEKLPYPLTDAQRRVLGEIRDGLCGPYVMGRRFRQDGRGVRRHVPCLAQRLSVGDHGSDRGACRTAL